MDALFIIGQVVWIAVLACGAYISFSFYELADESHARTARQEPARAASASSVGMSLQKAAEAVKAVAVGATISLAVSIGVQEMTPETIAMPEAPAAPQLEYANLSPDFFGESRLAPIATRGTLQLQREPQRMAEAAR
jgi:negative regulator of sigma E activity